MKKTGTTTVRYEKRTMIDRPIGDVFERLADVDGYGKWMHRTGLFRRSGQTFDGPLGPGTAYSDATRMGTFRGQITDYQPPSRLGFRETLRWFGFDLMEARPEYFLEADRDRTIVHHVAEGDLFGVMRLMKPVAALMARSERARTIASLRRSLEPEASKLTLEMRRALPAAPSVVFHALSDPDKLAQWWGPEGFTVPSLEFDPDVGASYRIEMQPPDGEPFHLTGKFRDVDSPVHLAFTFVYQEPDPDDVDTLVELSLRDLGESTEVVFTQGPFKTAARRDLHRDGWTDSFDKLERFLSKP